MRKRFSILLLIGLLGIAFLVGKFYFFPPQEKSPSPDSSLSPSSKETPPSPPDQILAGKISKGQNLSSALRAQNLPRDLVEAIGRHLKTLVNLRKVRPGDSFELRLNPQGQFLSFTYQPNPLDIYQLSLSPTGDWLATKKEVPVEKYWARVSGEIFSSLFEAMDRLGERDTLVMDFADIFAWEIDFHSDPQPGDRFEMVVEKYFVQDTFVKYGRILYADYQRESRRHQASFFDPPGKRGDYYTPQGESLRKAFLRSPLKFTRISSGYSKSRHHPILGGERPHLGVDYAAPPGSPVWAVADGAVVSCGWNGGYGKQIVIKHPQGYQSMYGHLSNFSRGISKGKTVQQKQIIGYVGSTGLSTGPHLDFRLLKNGVHRNPLKEISPRAPSLTGGQMAGFKESIEPVLQWVRDPSALQQQKVASLTSRELENSVMERRKRN
jgi:murein DD-endopeptidase MepM/ murein hydrolase activator NlpD